MRRLRLGQMLVLALLIGCVAAFLNYRFQLFPVTHGLRFDLVAGRMQYYTRSCGIETIDAMKDHYYRDRLARLYLKYIGPWPKETDWVFVYEDTYWLGKEIQSEETEFHGIQWDQNGMANCFEPSIYAPRTYYGLTNEAALHVIQRFLEYARESRSAKLGFRYAGRLVSAVMKADHKLNLTDVIAIETKLQAEFATTTAGSIDSEH